MRNKTILLTVGELRSSNSGGFSVEVDALEALKAVGMAYGLYSHAEQSYDHRIIKIDGEHPALVMQENISYHGSPCWNTVRTITDDPKKIGQYMAFREIVGIIGQIEGQRERDATHPTHEKSDTKRKTERGER